MNKDIAAGVYELGNTTPLQLWAGEYPITTDAYKLAADVTKYQVCVYDGATVTPFTGDAGQATQRKLVASQDGKSGDEIGFFTSGNFNHEALGWPAAITAYEDRRKAVGVGPLTVGRIVN